MGTNQQSAPHGQLPISKEARLKRNMEINEAHIIGTGTIERAPLRDGQALVPVNQGGPRPHQYDTSSNRESPAFSQQDGISRQRDRTGQYEEAQGGDQRHPNQDRGRIQTLMGQFDTLNQLLQQERSEKDYYKFKTLKYYLRLCIHEPRMSAEHRRKAETLLVADATPPTFAPVSSATISSDSRPSALLPLAVPSVSRPFAPPPLAAIPSVPHASTPRPCGPRPCAPRPCASRPSAPPPPAPRPSAPPPPAPRSSAPRPSTTRPSAPHHGAVLSSAPSRRTPSSVFPVTASALHIDLTIDETPPSPPTSQKRKRAPEQESLVGDQLRRKILTKKFEWMKPEDRPNFEKRNPYKPSPSSFERPLDIDPTEIHEQYPTQALHYDHDLGQACQEPLLVPNQAPTHPPAPAKLPNPKKNKPSGPRVHRPNKDKPEGDVRTQRISEARERMKTKKKQIVREQNAIAAEKAVEQEAEDCETMAAEMEAMLEQVEPGDSEELW